LTFEIVIIHSSIPLLNLTDSNPTGWARFDDDGKGEQNYSFTLFGNTTSQTGTFRWEADDDFISIDRINDTDMQWARNENSTNRQVATFNIVVDATQNWDYTLTLTK